MSNTPSKSAFPPRGNANGFVSFSRKIYNPLGFKHGYNFPLFVILVGALLGFSLSRFMLLDVGGTFLKGTLPSEVYYYIQSRGRIGITMHLGTIMPAAFLACFQFVPVIRHKVILFHRINGYIIILLLFVSNAGVFMIARHAAGGHPHTQTIIGILGTATTISVSLAYYNIKRLRIDRHRAWMLRTWVWAGSIITLRLVLLPAMTIVDKMEFYEAQRCDKIFFGYDSVGVPAAHNPTAQLYPGCGSDPATSKAHVAVPAGSAGPENVSVGYNLTFGLAAFIALVIHVVGVEVYLHVTPGETERLRVVSRERRAKAGMEADDTERAGEDDFGKYSSIDAESMPLGEVNSRR
ncbi:hypothetical protein LTR37_008056 [Vermiconidia calcicola]|uniref:Uncharacterized protein n=1 Tax=Vermiconidia calcicola TaxID=1690605 RepID=A0ACC3NBM1_9PEZI|nr:hypothetical protein LTR37_008056 [Vermiconidia calcicola]